MQSFTDKPQYFQTAESLKCHLSFLEEASAPD